MAVGECGWRRMSRLDNQMSEGANFTQRRGIGDGPERRNSAGLCSAERGGRGPERRAGVYAVLGAVAYENPAVGILFKCL